MSFSGVSVADQCVENFNDMKLRSTKRFIIYKLNDSYTQIDIEHEMDSTATYKDFVACLPADQPRFAVVDFKFCTDDGTSRKKLIFISWSPDSAPIKMKMVYASSKEALRRKFIGIGKEIQATDASEIDEEEVLGLMKK